MAFLADFVKGFADKKVSEMDEEKKRLAEMDEWEKKLLFQQKLEEAASKKKPTGQRIEGSEVIFTNAYGEEVFRRPASEFEIKGQQAAASELDAKLYQNDPERLKAAEARAEAESRSAINARNASAAASMASADESRQRTKNAAYELDTTQDMMGDLGPPSGRGFPGAIGAATGGAGDLRYNAGDLAKLARVEGALKAEVTRIKEPAKKQQILDSIKALENAPLAQRIQTLNAIAAELDLVTPE